MSLLSRWRVVSCVCLFIFIYIFQRNFPNSVKTVKCAVNPLYFFFLFCGLVFFLHAFHTIAQLLRIEKKENRNRNKKSSIYKTRTIPLCALPFRFVSLTMTANWCWGCLKKRITCQSNEKTNSTEKKPNYFIANALWLVLQLAQHNRPCTAAIMANENANANALWNMFGVVTLRRHAKSIIGNAFLLNWFGNSANLNSVESTHALPPNEWTGQRVNESSNLILHNLKHSK